MHMREFSPNFSLLVESGDESTHEYNLDQLPQNSSMERANALFGRGKSDEKIRALQSQYFELITEGMKQVQARGTGKGSEIVLSNQSKPFAKLETKLLALLAPLENLYRSEQDITEAIKKLQHNFQAQNSGLDSKLILDAFPKGRGLYNALKCYRDRLKAPLPEGSKRMIYLQPELDAKADTDFIEIMYKMDEMQELIVQELNFIQVKSSDVSPSTLDSIQRKHQELAAELSQDLSRLNERFYPEIKFKDEEERSEILFASILELVTPVEGETPLARLDRCINLMPGNKTNSNWSKNGPTRFEADAISQLAFTLEAVGSEEDWLLFYNGLRDKYKKYTPIKAAQSLKEIRRHIEKDPSKYPHLIHNVELLEATLPPETVKSVSTPHITKIEKIQSVTTVGSKTVPGGIKTLGTDKVKPKYMVHRA
jgi:hypothetical protein